MRLGVRVSFLEEQLDLLSEMSGLNADMHRHFQPQSDLVDCDCSGTIAQLRHAFLFSAMNTAKDRIVLFNSVADNMRTAMRASRCEGLDRAFEAVKDVVLSV